MTLTALIIYAMGLVARLAFLKRFSAREDIFNLAHVLIAFQDRRISATQAIQHLAPFREVLPDYLNNLAKGREADEVVPRGSIRLPLGCRLGLLQFSPLLQLAMLLGLEELENPKREGSGYKFQELPKTKQRILEYFEKTCGWRDYIDELVRRRFGHTLIELADYLCQLRRRDPILFVLLMVREFKLAEEYLEHNPGPDDASWLERTARLAEVQRLAEMMTYLEGRKLIKISLIRKALKAMVFSKRPNQRKRARLRFRKCWSVIRRLNMSVEAVRALFVGDKALLALNPVIRYLNWASIPVVLKNEAAASCEIFSENRSKRHRGARRDCLIDMYYGIGLDDLACIGLHELTVGVAASNGADDCGLIAQCMASQLIGPHAAKGYNRMQRRVPMLSDAYLRHVGKRGCGGRFDHRLQLKPEADARLYECLAEIMLGRPSSADQSSVRKLIGVIAQGLTKTKARFGKAADVTTCARIMCYLFSSLTLATMDPIFASLLDRAMTERGVPPNGRTNPWGKPKSRPVLVAVLRATYRGVRERFARFKDLGGRPNHLVDPRGPAPEHRPLTVQPSPPRPTGPSSRRRRRF